MTELQRHGWLSWDEYRELDAKGVLTLENGDRMKLYMSLTGQFGVYEVVVRENILLIGIKKQ
jgi:hypothetical protein